MNQRKNIAYKRKLSKNFVSMNNVRTFDVTVNNNNNYKENKLIKSIEFQ